MSEDSTQAIDDVGTQVTPARDDGRAGRANPCLAQAGEQEGDGVDGDGDRRGEQRDQDAAQRGTGRVDRGVAEHQRAVGGQQLSPFDERGRERLGGHGFEQVRGAGEHHVT
jgi:hypothetical protein